jgi:hypothetical protein
MSSQNYGKPPGYPPGYPPGPPQGSPPQSPPGYAPGQPQGYPPAAPPGSPYGSPYGAPPQAPPGAPPGSPYGSPYGAPPQAPPGAPAGQPPTLASPPQDGYSLGAPPPAGGPSDIQKPKNEMMAIISLAAGIASVLCIFPGCCCYLSFVAPLPGIAAVITGYLARKKIAEDPVNLTGGMLALIGMICGGTGTALFFVFLILYILGIAGGVISDLMNKF